MGLLPCCCCCCSKDAAGGRKIKGGKSERLPFLLLSWLLRRRSLTPNSVSIPFARQTQVQLSTLLKYGQKFLSKAICQVMLMGRDIHSICESISYIRKKESPFYISLYIVVALSVRVFIYTSLYLSLIHI